MQAGAGLERIECEDLIALIRNYNPRSNCTLIRDAYEYGMRMHEGQFRHSGEPYFTHPVAVAAILTEMRLDDATIVTALLHDTIEDTRSTWADVAQLFGRDIADLIDGVTKLTNLQLSGTHSKQAENFRKLFMAMSRDLRVILVKLADRLHNMRTIKSMRPEKQVQKARETMDIYAPLAGRMGMQWMREELEDLAFKVINPEGRSSIIRRFVTLQKETGDVVPRISPRASCTISAKRVSPPGPRCSICPCIRASWSPGASTSPRSAASGTACSRMRSRIRSSRSSTKRRGSRPVSMTESMTRKTPAASSAPKAVTAASSSSPSVKPRRAAARS